MTHMHLRAAVQRKPHLISETLNKWKRSKSISPYKKEIHTMKWTEQQIVCISLNLNELFPNVTEESEKWTY